MDRRTALNALGPSGGPALSTTFRGLSGVDSPGIASEPLQIQLTTRSGENRPLTAIRGLAALWVAGSHLAGQWPDHWPAGIHYVLAMGFLGVDLFFVLSGFILAVVYWDLNLGDIPLFLTKRFLRVYPLHLAVMAAMVATAAAGIVNFGTLANWPQIQWFVFMMEPFAPTRVLAWNIATWSVGVEIICYLAFPWLIGLLRRLPTPGLATFAVVALLAGCFGQRYYLGWWWGPLALLRGFGGFVPGLALGLLARRIARGTQRAPGGLWSGPGALGCAAGLAVVVCTGHLRWVPLFAGGLIYFLYFDIGIIARALQARWCFWLGEVSFSIYLLHAPLLGQMVLIPFVLSHYMPWTLSIGLFVFAIYLPVVLLLSWATYRWIEQPGRRVIRLVRRTGVGHPA